MNSKIMIIWGFIITIICACLIILGNIGSDYTLYKLEKNIKTSAREYLKDKKLVPNINESQVIYIKELIEEKYIDKDDNIEKYCIKDVKMINKILVDEYTIEKDCENKE